MKIIERKILQNLNLFRIVFGIIVLVSIFFMINSETDRSIESRINASIDKGIGFLQTADLERDIFAGYYDICKKDVTKCPYYPYPISVLYKKIDASLDFVFLKEYGKRFEKLDSRIEERDRFLRNLLPEWEEGEIDFSYQDESRKPGDFAFDLYCILSLEYNDTKMFNKLMNELSGDDWFNPLHTDYFRKIIDETWCISLLGKLGSNKTLVYNLVRSKIAEAEDFIQNPKYLLDKKIIVDVHILLMLDRLESYGYDVSEFKGTIKESQIFIKENVFKELKYPDEVYFNSLYVLAKTNFEDKFLMKKLTIQLISIQNENGSWSTPTDPRFKILSTLRSIIALEEFRLKYLAD